MNKEKFIGNIVAFYIVSETQDKKRNEMRANHVCPWCGQTVGHCLAIVRKFCRQTERLLYFCLFFFLFLIEYKITEKFPLSLKCSLLRHQMPTLGKLWSWQWRWSVMMILWFALATTLEMHESRHSPWPMLIRLTARNLQMQLCCQWMCQHFPLDSIGWATVSEKETWSVLV